MPPRRTIFSVQLAGRKSKKAELLYRLAEMRLELQNAYHFCREGSDCGVSKGKKGDVWSPIITIFKGLYNPSVMFL